jgi:hypothetical protein
MMLSFDRFFARGKQSGMQNCAVSVLAKTYEIAVPPEPAIRWEVYAAIIEQELQALLANPNAKERDYQEFFERHPSCLPQMYPIYQRGAHGPFPAIVSQPVLPGYSRKMPDFLYITRDSGTVYAVLIEIEDPAKPWATESGQQSSQFSQATNQLLDWKSWFREPTNVLQFWDLYRLPSYLREGRSFEQKYFLIYGRRSDPTLSESFNKKRKDLERPDETHMTYDRIQPSSELRYCLCAKLNSIGYRAISVPPTIELGPMDADINRVIRGKDDAVRANRYLSEVRKMFLIERWPYWDNWKGGGVKSSGDRE